MKDFMKRLNFLTAIMLLSLSIILVGCSDDDDPVTPQKSESEILLNYLETTGGDYLNTAAPALISATDVQNYVLTSPAKIHIIDIRSSTDYTTLGHIKGAVNKTIPELYDYFKTGFNSASYEKVVIVCYTGQSAGYSTSLIRLLGYNNVFSMKFGMSSWHLDFATGYLNTVAGGNIRQSTFVKDATPKAAKGTVLPTITTGKTDGKEILEARVKALLALGYISAISNADGCAITNADMYADLSKFYIVNYWPATHYADPGHVPGAMQYTPKESLKSSMDLMTLPIDKDIVVYCYTGQTSAQVAAFLRVLGYKARTLQFGTSAMIKDLAIEKGFTVFQEKDIIGGEIEK